MVGIKTAIVMRTKDNPFRPAASLSDHIDERVTEGFRVLYLYRPIVFSSSL